MRHLPILAAILLLAAAARADQVLLTNGNTLEGKARREGDEVVVATGFGEMRLKASEVRSIIPGRTLRDDYEDKAKAAPAGDAAAQVALGDWCRLKGLGPEAKRHWAKAIEIDPDQPDARKRLGYLRYEGGWVTLDQYFRARGLVKVGDAWMSEEEARRLDAAKLQREALKKHEKTIRDAVLKMGSMKRKTRAAGKLALQQYAESIGDLRLAAFASDVAAYYNAAWRGVREALVKVEVRATWTQLKRPIPTLTTSLGANTTPVTIQLPELSVVSIRTTVLVPAEIELDEDP